MFEKTTVTIFKKKPFLLFDTHRRLAIVQIATKTTNGTPHQQLSLTKPNSLTITKQTPDPEHTTSNSTALSEHRLTCCDGADEIPGKSCTGQHGANETPEESCYCCSTTTFASSSSNNDVQQEEEEEELFG